MTAHSRSNTSCAATVATSPSPKKSVQNPGSNQAAEESSNAAVLPPAPTAIRQFGGTASDTRSNSAASCRAGVSPSSLWMRKRTPSRVEASTLSTTYSAPTVRKPDLCRSPPGDLDPTNRTRNPPTVASLRGHSGTLAQASLQRTLQSRRSQSSLQRVYTVIGSPDRPRPVLRTANPSLAATRRDGSFCPSST